MPSHDPTLCREQLATLMAEQNVHLAALESLLTQEYELLQTRNAEGLEKAATARQQCIGHILRIEDERRALLAEHGQLAREYPDVRANTVAAFALGDYEWMLAFEADELHRIVDLMRELRASRARMHVREEVPFYTGRRKPVAELVAALP
jgi:flagellar biosynthesis/type III secretory pathway chaperone